MKESKTIHTLFDFFDKPHIKSNFNISYLKDEFEYQKKLAEFNESKKTNGESITIKITESSIPAPPNENTYIDPRELDFTEYLNIIIEFETTKLLYEIEKRFFSILNKEEKSTFLTSIDNKLSFLEKQYSDG